MTGRGRKPPWLRILCPEGNYGRLKPRRCGSCGRWLISLQDGVWESYDPGVIRAGRDLTNAIILGRNLARIMWDPLLRQAYLVSVYGSCGLEPDGTYLAEHDCAAAPVSVEPFRPPPRRKRGSLAGLPRLSGAQVREFEKAWNRPLEGVLTDGAGDRSGERKHDEQER